MDKPLIILALSDAPLAASLAGGMNCDVYVAQFAAKAFLKAQEQRPYAIVLGLRLDDLDDKRITPTMMVLAFQKEFPDLPIAVICDTVDDHAICERCGIRVAIDRAEATPVNVWDRIQLSIQRRERVSWDSTLQCLKDSQVLAETVLTETRGPNNGKS